MENNKKNILDFSLMATSSLLGHKNIRISAKFWKQETICSL